MTGSLLDPSAPEQRALGVYMDAELESQPDVWERAIAQAGAEALLPADGQRVAVVGCGSSWFMAQCYTAARNAAGKGVTDAYSASEATPVIDRAYDSVIAITRSGTTTEIVQLLKQIGDTARTVAVVGDPESPVTKIADAVVELPYADEQSVVQTRFATTGLVYLLTSLGIDLTDAVADARDVLAMPVDDELLTAEQFSFLGRGWTVGLAHEAALKMREACQGWTESYPMMEYRHGPIAIAAPNRVTWLFGEESEGLSADIARTGARCIAAPRHPLAELVRAHRVTLERARARGLDPDQPRNLTRSVILQPQD